MWNSICVICVGKIEAPEYIINLCVQENHLIK